MTHRLLHIYETLCIYLPTCPYPPTVREVTRLCGLSSYGNMYAYLKRLREMGLVTWEWYRQRTLRLS